MTETQSKEEEVIAKLDAFAELIDCTLS